jgi:uncharacterized protein YqjF (DUF2071 family)
MLPLLSQGSELGVQVLELLRPSPSDRPLNLEPIVNLRVSATPRGSSTNGRLRRRGGYGIADMDERPFLTARWINLVLLNFRLPAEVVASVIPAGLELDLHEGQAYVSVVGFAFQNVRVMGVPVFGHTRFDEINLRYYVKRTVGKEVRRGVVFIREIVPRRAVAIVANRLYNENYITRPMRSGIKLAGAELQQGDTLEYAWRTRTEGREQRWNRLAARVASPLSAPWAGSLEEFIIEHYWGYVRGRDGCTHEYRVEHPTWRVGTTADVAWDCDLPATYELPFAEFLATPPASAIIADGSAVQVFRGRRCV